MRNATCQPIVRTVLDHLAAGRSWRTESTSVRVGEYTDPRHLACELTTLFTTIPQAVAISADLPQAGSHITRDGVGPPMVLTRDEAGTVHALANVCAHRGAQVVADGRDCHRRLSCPYHAWTYDLAGRLVGVPDRDAFPDVDVPGAGLRRLPVVERHGVIWVVPDLGADPEVTPEPGLGALADDLDTFDIAGHRFWRNHHFDLALNWKLVVDTFLEPYHFPALHRTTVGPYFLPNLCVAERFGSHVREVLPRRTITELEAVPPTSWDIVPHSALVYVLFPCTVLIQLIDHIEVWRVMPHPTDPSRSSCDLDFYVPIDDEQSDGYWERNWRLTIDTVVDEDFAVAADLQRNLCSGVLDHARFGANEPALSLFHTALTEALSPAR